MDWEPIKKAVLKPEYWAYGASTLASGYLVFAPVVGQWSNKATSIAFGLSVPCLAASIVLGKKLDTRVTIKQVDGQLATQWQIDRMADDLNLGRAQFDQLIDRMMNGAPLSEQLMMGSVAHTMGGFAPLAELPAAKADPLQIPVEDLAQTIAQCDSDEQNFLFVGKSRSGKTSLLVNAIAQKDAVNNGNVDWFVFNGKPEKDNDWGGLRNSPNDYWAVNSEAKAMEMFSQLKSCIKALQGWQDTGDQHYPMVIIADEINNQRILLDEKNCKQLDQKISLYATQCMSEHSGLWLSMHSHNVEDAGLNRKLQQSFQIVALGRNSKYESIEAILDDQYSIRSKETRDRLKSQLKNYIASGDNGSIAFTNIGGNPRLVKLPHYSKEITLQRNALNAPSEELVGEDSPFDTRLLERLLEVEVNADYEQFYYSDRKEETRAKKLPNEAIAIYVFSARKGAVTARDCLAGVKALRDKSSEDVRQFFLLLEGEGKGLLTGDGSALTFTAFPEESE